MTLRGVISIVLVALASLSTSGAGAESDSRSFKERWSYSGRTLTEAGAASDKSRIPIESIFDQLRRQYGFSFIYDSQLLQNKYIAPLDFQSDPETALRMTLATAGLDLHKLAHNKFAITEISYETAPVSFSAAAQQPLFADVIFVVATADLSGSGYHTSTFYEIDRQYLSHYPGQTPAEVINELPQSVASFTPYNTTLFGPASGLNFADLRGLGIDRTLVMINGRRATPTLGGNTQILGVDLNRFSTPMLDRIEVETMSAGARHGAGSAAGVINFVTRKNMQGLEAGADFGISEMGDSEEVSLHVIAGKDLFGGAANITGGVNFITKNGLVGADRVLSQSLSGLRYNEEYELEFAPGYGDTTLTQKGLLEGVVLEGDGFSYFPNDRYYIPNGDGSPEMFIGLPEQRYKAIGDMTIDPPMDRFLGYVTFDGDLGGVRLYLDAHGGIVNSDVQLAPFPGGMGVGRDLMYGNAVAIPLDHPSVPTALSDFIDAQFADPVEAIVLSKRYNEFGVRTNDLNRQFQDVNASLEFNAGADWLFGIDYHYGRTRTHWRNHGYADVTKFPISLDPTLCAATAGCVEADFFDPNGLSPEAVDYLQIEDLQAIISLWEHAATARAQHTISGVFAEDAILDLGVEFRKTFISTRTWPQDSADAIGVGPADGHRASLETVDFTAGVDLPILRDSGAGEIDLFANLRFQESNVYDSISNVETALKWRPVDGVELNGHYHAGHRAPHIGELFHADLFRAGYWDDPCGAAVKSSIVEKNCASVGPLGVSPGFEEDAMLTYVSDYGSPNLDSEDVRSYAVGATVRPTEFFDFIPGELEFSATWLSIEVDNLVSVSFDIVADCYESGGFSAPACGVNPITGRPYIERDPDTEQLLYVSSFKENLDEAQSWQGLDMEMRYGFEPRNPKIFSRIWLSAKHTYTDKVEYTDHRTGNVDRLEGFSANPRHDSIIGVGVERDIFQLGFQLNRRGHVRTVDLDLPEAQIPAIIYVGASFRADIADNAYIQIAVENLIDHEAPIAIFGGPSNTLPNYYDIVGRRFTLSTRVRF